MVNLDEIVTKNVELNTLIITDCWNDYQNVENIGYLHEKINHSKNFLTLKISQFTPKTLSALVIFKIICETEEEILKKNLKQYFVEFKFLKFSKNPFEKLKSRISFLSSKKQLV
ncbi:hypothetical protein CDIK_4180 [Cucumispora dikerogammari]|nr:hypothetical protein CDIK_4180 [Cucumispora dikerogammari]